MTEPETVLSELYVQPGESVIASVPVVMRTVLGSCVGLTFLVRRLGIGALCHPMHPSCPGGPSAHISRTAGRRYVDFVVRDLARQLDALGARRDEVEVKVFGGADVLAVSGESTRPTVGAMNCESALRVLREEDFQVAASCLGGTSGVNIMFHTGTGEVLLRRLT
jgi:chemotaxis protein CheD